MPRGGGGGRGGGGSRRGDAAARDERRFLESQIQSIDQLMRQFTLLQSTMSRRMRRLQRQTETMRAAAPQTPPRLPAPVRAPGAPARRPGRPRREAIHDAVDVAPMALVDVMEQEALHGDEMFEDDDTLADNNVENLVGVFMHQYDHLLNEPIPPIRVRHTQMPKVKIQAIKKSLSTQLMQNACSVCHENYTKKDCLTMNCQHDICTTCYTRWAETQFPQEHRVTCPMCRELVKSVVGYRERAPRRTATEMAAIRAGAGAT